MSISITKQQLLAMNPCDGKARMKLFGDKDSMDAAQALAAGATVFDLLWVAGRLGLKRQCVQFGLECAQRVAYLNTDPRVKAALDATQAWIDDPSDQTARAALAAADAALATADAARAAAADAALAAAADAVIHTRREKQIQQEIFLRIFGAEA